VGKLRTQIFHNTSTLGVREAPWRKVVLDRAFVEVRVDGGTIAVKVGHVDGVVLQVMPEFEDVVTVARRRGRPERLVLLEAANAAAAAGLTIGAPFRPGTGPRRRP
jgi:uncharacterized protein (DUF111 family)